ncbi:hypothetical protein [Actomonas aquatica]|uniref:Uncharacterized protein n=1 Tax=Actomonas aquatica TaxID=2866162 RepID=A0ABZ1C4E3_9BACT|nr:hypothetical protein [Opitutus sp. WL0086]WRQ86592.1 hypothetical protein K1X11_017410 [Opitutus sp. WL0086]
MRRSLTAIFVSLLLTAPAIALADTPTDSSATRVQLVRVWPGYRDATSFTRLGEYFGSSPDAINQNALRSQPNARGGYYWLIRTDAATAYPGTTVQLEVVRPGTTQAEPHTFTFDLPAGSHAVHVGLTGRDWIDPEEAPVAWSLTLTATDGTLLAAEQSFLWTDYAP